MTPGMVLNERYRILAVIGEGGMARVFRAEDTRLGRVVALKTLHPRLVAQPEFVHRFEQEAQLAAGLTHPNIVAIYDRGRAGVIHYIVMEYVGGGSLKSLIAREGPLPLGRVMSLIAQLGAALDAAHARGVVHRDIKPENILLTPTGEVKVSDFGIARALTDPKQTATGMMLGSVSYVAPEQAQGRPTSAASDLYSSGVVAYEMLTGRLPFVSDTALGIAMQHVTQEPAPPSAHIPSLPPIVDSVVLRCLSKNPAGRFPSGAAMARALAAATTAGHSMSTRQRAMAPTLATDQSVNSGRTTPNRRAAGRFHRVGPVFRALIRRPTAWLLLLLLGGGAVLAATHQWEPQSGGQSLGAMQRATSTVVGAAPTAAGAAPTAVGTAPTVVPSPTPRTETNSVAVPATSTPPPAATATAMIQPTVAQPTATVPASPTTGTGDTAESSQATAATAGLRVTQSGTTANVYLTFANVPVGAAVGARWTFPDGGTTDWSGERAYSTNPSYFAYVLVGPAGRYQVAALVNGNVVGTQDFTVADHTTASPAGNQSNPGAGNNGTFQGFGHVKRHGRGHN